MAFLSVLTVVTKCEFLFLIFLETKLEQIVFQDDTSCPDDLVGLGDTTTKRIIIILSKPATKLTTPTVSHNTNLLVISTTDFAIFLLFD